MLLVPIVGITYLHVAEPPSLTHQKKVIKYLPHRDPQCSCSRAFHEDKILQSMNTVSCKAIFLIVTSKNSKFGDHHQYNTRNASPFSLLLRQVSVSVRKPTYRPSWYLLKQHNGKNLRKLLQCVFSHLQPPPVQKNTIF